jgi:hypothetical protein
MDELLKAREEALVNLFLVVQENWWDCNPAVRDAWEKADRANKAAARAVDAQ